ncbi:MAG: hypothetical protein ACU0CA_14070 [Paracoccaceae bacterium]
MNRKLIALMLTFSLILTGFSAIPARAGSNDFGKLAIGAFAGLLVGTMISNSNDHKSKSRKSKSHKKNKKFQEVSRGEQAMRYFAPYPSSPSHKNFGHNKKSKKHKKNKKRHSKINKNLPGSCFFNLRTPYGPRGVYGKKCLNETMRNANRLPIACHDNVNIRHGRRSQVFGARCLRNHGYRTSSNNRRTISNHRPADNHRSDGIRRSNRY